tara:strand:- start:768 stop:974 length:207 start_codon:yes stop_codon:yes gene_type:complete
MAKLWQYFKGEQMTYWDGKTRPVNDNYRNGYDAIFNKKKKKPKEIGGTKGPEPTRFGDWEHKGRCYDF